MAAGDHDDNASLSVLYRAGRVAFEDIWTSNQAMKACIEKARLVASHDISVLLLGETGTGKNLLAQAIHNASRRQGHPFVAVNVGALPHTLVESELFGSEEGAFTGARARRGFFEQAHKGTLFLDEIGTLSPECQHKLLAAVEYRRIQRLGAERALDCDVRLVSATNADLSGAVEAGTFRRDLYHRVARVELRVPPLRERIEDIEALALRFVARGNAEFGRHVRRISEACLARMAEYSWPGNVRELRTRIDSAMLYCGGEELRPDDVFPDHADDASSSTKPGMELAIETVERRHVLKVLKMTGWNITRAADLLHVARQTLYEKIEKYGLSRPS